MQSTLRSRQSLFQAIGSYEKHTTHTGWQHGLVSEYRIGHASYLEEMQQNLSSESWAKSFFFFEIVHLTYKHKLNS